MTQKSRLLQSCFNFTIDKSGNFGILTALVLPVVLAAAGSAVDFSVAHSERTNLQDIADGAVLAGGGVFDGTNFPEAKAMAEKFIKAQAVGATDEEVSKDDKLGVLNYKISAVDKTLTVAMTKPVPTSLMKIMSVNSIKVGVKASALSPMKPEKITFTPTKAQGWYFKRISILVLRKGATKEELLGTVTYQPTTRNDSGQGTYVAQPAGVIDLGKYTNLALRMDIKFDGCDIGYKVSVGNNNAVTCSKSNNSGDQSYNSVLRTDDPATSNYLFVDGKQVPQGMKTSLEKYFGCTKKQEHAWEDGGGWERQDFFYTVTATCGADGTYVRLVK